MSYFFRWVFKQLYDKGMVYRGVKVMPFSTACNTPLSNFESHQNYKVCTQNPTTSHLNSSAVFIMFFSLRKITNSELTVKTYLFPHICVSFLSPGCSGPISDRYLPTGWKWGCGFDRLDNHTLDTAEQPGPVCQPRVFVRQGQRWEMRLHVNNYRCADWEFIFLRWACWFEMFSPVRIMVPVLSCW